MFGHLDTKVSAEDGIVENISAELQRGGGYRVNEVAGPACFKAEQLMSFSLMSGILIARNVVGYQW